MEIGISVRYDDDLAEMRLVYRRLEFSDLICRLIVRKNNGGSDVLPVRELAQKARLYMC